MSVGVGAYSPGFIFACFVDLRFLPDFIGDLEFLQSWAVDMVVGGTY